MIIGFTGTQRGTTVPQRFAVEHVVFELLCATEVHHGDCVGADAELHVMAGRWLARRVVHPPADPRKRAFCGGANTVILPPKPYVPRDHDIVDACQVLVAAPHQEAEVLRSGTWLTWRYAGRIDRPRVIVTPRGAVLTRGVDLGT